LIKYCKNCLYPETKPDLHLDQNGICNACNFVHVKDSTDWNSRKNELTQIFEKYRNKDGTNYDCIIPVSGGKDSTYQAYVVKEDFGLNPLCVSFHLPEMTEIGRKNIENLKNLGFDCLEFTPNPEINYKMEKIALMELGDPEWPNHFGIFTFPIQVAVRFKIPLIVWGENSQAEYGGSIEDSNKSYLDINWRKNYGTKIRGHDEKEADLELMLKHGIDRKYHQPFVYPSDAEIQSVGVIGIFLGHFIRWNSLGNLEQVKKLGFSVGEIPTEGTYTNYENLDHKLQGFHDYFKWIKFGYGRATDNASIEIRSGILTRDEGLKLVKEFEGKLPERYLDEYLHNWKMTRDEFLTIVDKFTNKELFQKDTHGNLLRDSEGNLTKINYDNTD